MPRDSRREPILVHINELFAQDRFHILDTEVDIRAIVDRQFILDTKEVEWREPVVYWRIILRDFLDRYQLIQAGVQANQALFHHLPSFIQAFRRTGIAFRCPELDTHPQAAIRTTESAVQAICGQETSESEKSAKVNDTVAVSCMCGKLRTTGLIGVRRSECQV